MVEGGPFSAILDGVREIENHCIDVAIDEVDFDPLRISPKNET